MTPFLKLVADDLYRKLGGDFQSTTIIFPNKRASLFFNQYLWENAGGKTIWTPEYTTISELFASLSDHVVGDPMALTVKLFEVYAQKMNPTKGLDELWGLMEMMLSDFGDIDNNMVEARKLFVNIADLKEMTDFSFLEAEQREAIERFFGRFFDDVTPDTPLKNRFKTLWNRMAEIYEDYRATLLHPREGEPMVYEGMLKREVIENLEHVDERLTSTTYVMIGFNVLSKTEMELFRYIKRNRDAKFYWDYDLTYTLPSAAGSTLLSKYEAGQFINENRRLLGEELRDKDLFRNMQRPKRITFIQSPTENAQTRYIEEWMHTHIREGEPLQESAVVLCNEGLLQPVLHSIGAVPALNVTMGYPLANTPVFSLVQVLLELQTHGRTTFGAWRYKQVAAVLKHSFVRKMAGRECDEKLRELSKRNVVFPEQEEFAAGSILWRLFTPVSGRKLTEYLADIISLVGHSYQDAFYSKDFTLQVYKESIFIAYTVVGRIRMLQEDHASLSVGDETLSRLIIGLLKQATIPFHGEPAVGLQVMGLLETRNLDFRNVIMLSAGEGQMPKQDKRPSLIPYTLRAAYGMTTIEKEVSLYAYYYYRLLQRAENITLIYNANTEGGGKGEMSRFMLQTLAEKDDLFAPGQDIDLRAFTSQNETLPAKPYQVVKDETVMRRLHERFNSESILSPSAINNYMKCPLKFYFTYVAGLRPEEDVSEDVDKPMFGILFHDAMRKLYAPYVGKPIACATLKDLAENTPLITQKLNNAFAVNLFKKSEKDEQGNNIDYGTDTAHRLVLNGTQLINRHVIRDFIVHQITADMKMAEQLENEGGYLQIISQEEKYTTHFPLQQGSSEGVSLGGYIDRLDLLHSPQGDRIRIVDYKTSNHQQTANTVADLFDLDKCTKNYHIMQTLYYAKVLTSAGAEYADMAVCPSLMYCAKDSGNNYSGIIKLETWGNAPKNLSSWGNAPKNLSTPQSLSQNGKPKKEEIKDFKAQYGTEFDALLTEKIEEIFTPYQGDDPENLGRGVFTQCKDEQNCQYCDFLSFCRRSPKKNY
ncbi:MAG: PD-(D/E)XK nuclease family protein [Bacteroidaceae bacterium]|nr:PD-(D/E)XK nuclease family protein [Bacteroidaceae bacterium]